MSRTMYSVSPRRMLQSFGPTPRKQNSVTFMPAHLAVTKWPSSCRKIITVRAAMMKIQPHPKARPSAPTPAAIATRRHGLLASSPSGIRASRRPGEPGLPWTGSGGDVGHSENLSAMTARGHLAGPPIGVDHVVDRGGGCSIMPGQDRLQHRGDRDPADPAVQEGRHGHLVGRVQPRRSGLPRPAGRVGEPEAREGLEVRRLEVEAPDLGPVDRPERRADPLGVGQRVGDREAHVGHRQLGDGGAVGELHHRVDDRLGVDHDLDPVVVHGEQLVGLDHLEALVHQRGGVDRDLRAHRPGGVGQGLLDRDGSRDPPPCGRGTGPRTR